MKKQYALLVWVGILSGVSVWFLSLAQDFLSLPWSYGFGALYGAVTGVYFIKLVPSTRKHFRLFVWILASAGSFIGAFYTAINSGHLFSDPAYTGNFALGGLAGALVLTAVFHFLFHKMSMRRHLVVLVTGAVVPYVLCLSFSNVQGGLLDSSLFYLLLFIVWQTAITTLLGSSVFSEGTLEPEK